MPAERRGLVKVVDTSGGVLDRVRGFLGPLVGQASKWPENAFVAFSEDFIYRVVVAQKYRAGIAADTIQVVREFVPIINTRVFRSEARYRLAELIQVIAAYEPVDAPHAFLSAPVVDAGSATRVDEILESAEFQRIVSTFGLLGLAKNPRLVLAKLWRQFRSLASKQAVKTTLRLASAAGYLGKLSVARDILARLADASELADSRVFSPPFLPLGSADLGIFREALATLSRTATASQGTIMVYERTCEGKRTCSWLNAGEEMKLLKEEQAGIGSRLASANAVREVQKRFF